MSAEWLHANLSVVVFVVVFVLFTLGLTLALRTPGGRDALAGGAVRLALAFLALAERWIGQQAPGDASAPSVSMTGAGRDAAQHDSAAARPDRVHLARVQLTAWLLARSERGAG